MFSDYRFLAGLYSAVVGFAMSFSALYILHLARVFIYGTVYYDDHHSRLLKACHEVEAHRVKSRAHGVMKPGKTVTTYWDTFRYEFGGHEYEYTRKSNAPCSSTVMLYFLNNPKTACMEDELGPKKFVWTKYVFPLGVLISIVLYRYMAHWMLVVQAR